MKRKKLIAVLIIMVLIVAFLVQQDNTLVCTEYTIKNEKIDENTEGYKVVQLSDLHNKLFLGGNGKVINMVQKEEPDVIVITGDITGRDNVRKNSLKLMEQLSAIAPVYYITGNHEYYAAYEERKNIMEDIRKAGVSVLVDETVKLKENLYLIGLDQRSLTDPTLEHLVADLPKEAYKITLAHEPQHFINYSASGTDLVLCGHAHGGQIRFPGTEGLFAPGQGILPKYTSGEHIFGGMTMIINRGIGNTTCPIRIFNYPEIVTITLKGK